LKEVMQAPFERVMTVPGGIDAMPNARDQARQEAVDLAAETMGELIAFWGFKASMGRIWTVLYLSPNPLTADAIAERTGLSAGAVSMGLADLKQWGVVDRATVPGDRKRHFRAETDVWGIVRRIFRERELRLVGRAMHRFEEASARIRTALESNPDDEELRFILGRLQGLWSLASIGYRMVETFAEIGTMSLAPIRDALRPGSKPHVD
jgi:HTH-type transcriptional regulator, glycine betaine synthesis regulator